MDITTETKGVFVNGAEGAAAYVELIPAPSRQPIFAGRILIRSNDVVFRPSDVPEETMNILKAAGVEEATLDPLTISSVMNTAKIREAAAKYPVRFGLMSAQPTLYEGKSYLGIRFHCQPPVENFRLLFNVLEDAGYSKSPEKWTFQTAKTAALAG